VIVGIIADVHGNIYGLEKCADVSGRLNAKNIFVLSNTINYFNKNRTVLDF